MNLPNIEGLRLINALGVDWQYIQNTGAEVYRTPDADLELIKAFGDCSIYVQQVTQHGTQIFSGNNDSPELNTFVVDVLNSINKSIDKLLAGIASDKDGLQITRYKKGLATFKKDVADLLGFIPVPPKSIN